MGKQHLMAYDQAVQDFRRSTYSVAIGGGFGVALLFSATALAAVAAPSYSSIQYSSGVSNLHSALDRYNARAGQRCSATEAGSEQRFIAPEQVVDYRIDFWNNRNRKLPIFIVIDDCPGGSVMAGYRILKAMEASDAPIHVVVKSFAASMAACITTLAEESYAYPNAVILHHQISSQIAFARLNLTQQKEFFQESNRWWERLAAPVAKKMGISTDEFIKKMYARSSSGDWSEFADEAKKLKWVNHIVDGILESSITMNPDADEKEADKKTALVEEIDPDGKVFTYLPRLNPKDVYFLYNPDGYYRMR